MMRSNSAPMDDPDDDRQAYHQPTNMMAETSETEIMSGAFESADLSSGESPSNMKIAQSKRKKQISALTMASGSSATRFQDEGSELTNNWDVKVVEDRSQYQDDDDDREDAHTPKGGNGWGKGIVRDIRGTLGTWWWKEMTNFNQQTVAVSFFIFFAAIAPAITFGAIYAKATHNWIGAVEMITATAWCGIVYSLIGGQPMMINGGTGPVLAFTEIIYKMSESLEVPFLTFNCWIGVWVFIYMCLAAFTDLNRIIVYATRFTDEIFALLIAIIFIVNALGNPFAPVGIFYYFDKDHSSHEHHVDDDDYSYMAAALLSFIICVGTVQVAFMLRKTKFSPFLPNQTLRNAVTDFAVVASIAFWTFVAQVLFKSVPTETLNVPDSFAPTYACCTSACDTNWPDDCPTEPAPAGRRDWFVDIGNLNGKSWVPFMAAGPAILAFILVFLDDGITWHLINHPAHKLTHGAAYNYDTLVIGVMILINSLLGLPWLVAATVRSLNHVHALAEKTPNGKIVSVRETRLTHLGIHLLCFVSIFALNALKLIPMPVLYGVFLFMGLVSLGTNQFWGRLQTFFMQPSKFPIEPYTQYMKPNRLRLFTLIQLALFVLLYVVKAIKTIAIAFPIIIALCIPIRLYILPKIFTPEELIMIDTDEETVKKYLRLKMATKKDVSFDDDQDQGEHDPDAPEPSAAVDVDMENQLDTDGVDRMAMQAVETSNEVTEDQDLVLGLPTQKDLNAKTRKERRRRKKSLSCPENMLFFDNTTELFAVAAETAEQELQAQDTDNTSQDDNSSTYSSDDEAALVPTVALGERMKMRRRRKKSLSCPTHMLFAEADRHLNNNYFFG